MLPRRPHRGPADYAALAAVAALAGLASGCAGLRPEPAGERMLYAEVALQRGDYARAASDYAAAAAASRDPKIAERAARIAFDNGQDRALEQIAREWLARDPGSEAARRFHAVALLQLDRRAEATREFAELVRSAYASPAEAFNALRESFGDLRNEAGAAAVVGSLARAWPGLPEAEFAHATLALAAGDSPTALAAAARAIALKPGWREAAWLQARAHVAGGDCSQGLKQSSALAAESSDADRLMHAWLLSACNRGPEAKPYFEDLARGRAARSEALDGLASIELEAHRYDEAASRYTEMLATGRGTDRAYFGLALTADRRGDAARALRLYAQISTGSRAVTAQLRAYRLLLQRGEAPDAARMLDEFVLASADERIAVTAGRAQVLADLGRGAQAQALLGRAVAAYPDREELRYARATVLERGGALEAALAELRAIARARPDDPAAQNALGFTLADHGRDLDEAERRIRAALAARPDSAAIRDSLGWVLYRRGRAAQGLEWLERAYAGDPDPEIATHIGEVQWSLGERLAAERTWRAGLERSPGEPHLKEALERHLGRRP
jgi:tetratricopeptide (TPR) repeat protein